MKLTKLSSQAFTLIELLVVIAIIAILAAILFPVFAQAKLAAKKTVDLSNMKQICLSTFIYNNDFDDVMPTIRNEPSSWNTSPSAWGPDTFQVDTIVEQLAPYVKNHNIWASPEDSLVHDTCTGATYTDYAHTGGPIDYIPTYNGQQNVISSASGWTTADDPESYGVFGMPYPYLPSSTLPLTGSLTTDQLSAPADTIIFAPMYISWSIYTGLVQQRTDQREFAFNQYIPDYPQVAQCPYCWCLPSDALSMEDFNGVANWAFGDGHAKSMPRSATMDQSWFTPSEADVPVNAIQNHAKNLFNANPGYN